MSFLKNIFKKEERLPPIDFSVFGADMHSHLIPGIDDGSKSIDDSLLMIRRFKELGYKKIVTTPHIMADYYKNTSDIILRGLDNVRNALVKENIDMEIEAAAEYNLDDGLEEKIKKRDILTFGDNYVLFELPFGMEPPNMQEIIFELQTKGYKPVLAHPERYMFWYKNFEKYHELKDRGVILQLNLLSLAGVYSPEIQKVAERMVDEDLVQFVGSDCHRIEHLEMINDHSHLKYLHILAAKEDLLNKRL